MNHRIIQLFALCMPAILLLAGCAPKDKTSIPVTGPQDASVPAMTERARKNVLEYVISSSRLTTVPTSADWQLDNEEQRQGEFHFRSGDWLMVIRLADDESQQVFISNQVGKNFWCGYVAPDGHVVDTTYMP